MRKNAVDKNIYSIDGGICAVEGFSAGAVRCGFKQAEDSYDLAVILADQVCPTAAVFTDNYIKGAPIILSKKHLKNGEAKAILINSGLALACNENADAIAKNLCSYMSETFVVYPTQVILASTGLLHSNIDESLYQKGIKMLKTAVSKTEEGSFFAAKAIMTTDKREKHGAFSFRLGDYPIKIGYIAKGNICVCPNMATTLCFLVTDVNISSKLLQKALSTQVRETLNMINIDGASSINDTVYLMSSCRAKNAKIVFEDTDYEKFSFALKQVLSIICQKIVSDNGSIQTIQCNVENAKSKQVARNLAKKCVGASFLKRAVMNSTLNVSETINFLGSVENGINFQNLQIRLCKEDKSLLVFENGRAIPYSKELEREILAQETLSLSIFLNEGNFSAKAWGNIAK